jgi:hypothetical protein
VHKYAHKIKDVDSVRAPEYDSATGRPWNR